MEYKTSEAKRASNKRYDQKTYTMMSLKVKKDIATAIKAHCNAKNCSVNGFIIGAALERMQADQAQGIGAKDVTQDAGNRADQRGE